MKDTIFKIVWVVIVLLFIGKLGQIAKEIHFLGVETRRVAFAVNSDAGEKWRRVYLKEMLKEAGFTDNQIDDYFRKRNAKYLNQLAEM